MPSSEGIQSRCPVLQELSCYDPNRRWSPLAQLLQRKLLETGSWAPAEVTPTPGLVRESLDQKAPLHLGTVVEVGQETRGVGQLWSWV